MDTALRIIGCIIYFTLMAPTIGFLLFGSYATAIGFKEKMGEYSFTLHDLLYSVVELWVPAMIAGVLFAIAAFPLRPHRPFMKNRLRRVGIAALALFSVFGIVIVERMIGGYRVSNSLILLATLGAITGAFTGAVYPRWLLPSK